jgi:O-acetyl-ADP-ribose deacetylase (regulator of RNase III)
MLQTCSGNLLEANVEALVNTVNCEGVMGRGIALQFKQAYPKNFVEYHRACKSGEVKLGQVQVLSTGSLQFPRLIINFPTKGHWRSRSKIEDIDKALDDLVRVIDELDIKSIAIPPLGCGNGGLSWGLVRPMIEKKLGLLTDVEILLYEPSGAPKADHVPVETKSLNLTHGKAVLLTLMEAYRRIDFDTDVNSQVIQKLCYFLQVCGEPLKLHYENGHFGPYADNLKYVLRQLEGHYIRGYGEGATPLTLITILPGALEQAEAVSKSQPDSVERIYKVMQLVEGFHTPYLLELLSTVHWVVIEEPAVSKSPEAVKAAVAQWSMRKKELFTLSDIKLALERLVEFKLIGVDGVSSTYAR